MTEYGTMRPRFLGWLPLLALSPLAFAGGGRNADAAPTATTCWIASAQDSASASASTSASSSASAKPMNEVEAAAARRRERERRSREVEIVDLTPEQELDPQRFAVGGDAGLGWLTNRGSGAGQPTLDFALSIAFGLGPGGAHEPWSIEAFAAFALTLSTIRNTNADPNRFTELGARLVYRAPGGPLAHKWLSIGAGLVFSSWGAATNDPERAHGDVAPGALVDLGVGVHEWLFRRGRVGFGLRVPVQLSAHPGVGALGVFYALIGVGK